MIKTKLFILGFLVTVSLFAQEIKPTIKPIVLSTNYTIKTNPFAMMLGPFIYTSEYRIAIENKTAQKQSVQIGFSYLGKNSLMKSIEENDSLYKANNYKYAVRGFRLQFSYRFFLDEEAPRGAYFSPHVSFSNVNIMLRQNSNVYRDNYIKGTYINYAGLFGYQIIQNSVAFDIFMGFGYRDNRWVEVDNNQTFPIDDADLYYFKKNFKMYFGFNAGIAF